MEQVKLPPGTKLAEGANIQAPPGYTVVKGAGAVKLDGFQLPEHKQKARNKRVFPVSKAPKRRGATTNMQRKQYAIALDRPAYNKASRRTLERNIYG